MRQSTLLNCWVSMERVLSWHHCAWFRVFLVSRYQARSEREVCLEKRWVGPKPLAHVLIFLSYLVNTSRLSGYQRRPRRSWQQRRESEYGSSIIYNSEWAPSWQPSICLHLGRSWWIWRAWGRCKQPPFFHCLQTLYVVEVRWWNKKRADHKNQKKRSS